MCTKKNSGNLQSNWESAESAFVSCTASLGYSLQPKKNRNHKKQVCIISSCCGELVAKLLCNIMKDYLENINVYHPYVWCRKLWCTSFMIRCGCSKRICCDPPTPPISALLSTCGYRSCDLHFLYLGRILKHMQKKRIEIMSRKENPHCVDTWMCNNLQTLTRPRKSCGGVPQ